MTFPVRPVWSSPAVIILAIRWRFSASHAHDDRRASLRSRLHSTPHVSVDSVHVITLLELYLYIYWRGGSGGINTHGSGGINSGTAVSYAAVHSPVLSQRYLKLSVHCWTRYTLSLKPKLCDKQHTTSHVGLHVRGPLDTSHKAIPETNEPN